MADTELQSPLPPDIWTFLPVLLKPDARRTVLRPFMPDYPPAYATADGDRTRAIIARVLRENETNLSFGLQRLADLTEKRHRNSRKALLRRFDELATFVPAGTALDERHKLLIGAIFSEEYSFEAAALFNPSIVRHWDQTGLAPGAIRFVMSLRGIGEGHISSVTFRTGTWLADGQVTIDPPSPYAAPPIIAPMEDQPDAAALKLHFEDCRDLSEAVLFPVAPSQKQGIEDLRLVAFTQDDGTSSYLGTYTAFSGSAIRPEMLKTSEFLHFSMRPFDGKVACNKGMALFPRRIDGRYAMLGRQDNENIWLMYSDDLYHWDEAQKLLGPCYPWEVVQMGNCGSPMEIDEGWLVMTHAVGLMRNYTIGACLLDKKDPSKLLGRATLPLLAAQSGQRDGYVPNVVYSCGALLDGRRLLLPYGVADSFGAIASTTVDQILHYLE
jgi:predicted GH43/DUF377 family glycosyl hydrolase